MTLSAALHLLTVALIVLKLTGVIAAASWFVVLLPSIIAFVLLIITVITLVVLRLKG